jgi:integrase
MLARFHDLLHSAATILISMGVNSKIVQERLGHSTISITLGVYVHLTLIDATRSKAEMR